MDLEGQADAMRQHLLACGLVSELRTLVARVWRQNLDRQDSEVAGDTTWSMSMLSAANIRELALRSPESGGLSGQDSSWSIGLNRASLQFTTPRGRLRIMKLPALGTGRTPDWSSLDWKGSHVRHDLALANSRYFNLITGGPGQEVLGMVEPVGAPVGALEFLIGWVGEYASPLTSGFLTVPVLGERSVLAQLELWCDEPSQRTSEWPSVQPGPNLPFDQLPERETPIRLKPRPGREEGGQ